MTLSALWFLLALLSVSFNYAGVAVAQDYPARPIRIVVPFSAGGATDVVFRILAPHLSEILGQQVVVDNRPGGASTIGMDIVAKSRPDGYTLGIANTSFGANPFLLGKLPYDTEKDFMPVTLVGQVPYVLSVHPSVPARSVKELVAIAKAKPGVLNYASAGIATGSHLGMEHFIYLTGIRMVHIPYGTGGRPILSTISGETAVFLGTIPTGIQHFKSGKLRPLGVSTLKRDSALPDLPTIAEAIGVNDFEVGDWTGVMVPAGTPGAVISRLRREFVKTLALPDVKERFAAISVRPVGSVPEELAMHIRKEFAKWSTVIKAAGIRVN